jgi:hypothetical protein
MSTGETKGRIQGLHGRIKTGKKKRKKRKKQT